MTVNLRFGLADDGENNWDQRKHTLLELFKKYPSDFICVQEANSFQADYLFTALPGYQAVGRRDPAPDFWQHNMIFFHESWGQSGFKHFYLSHTPDIPSRFMESRWPRQCTMARFEKNGKTLVVIDTHFDFSVSVQNKSAQIILERLCAFNRPETKADGKGSAPAVVLAGDFNASPKDPCYSILTGETDAQGPCFQDALEGKEPNAPGTHHGFTGNPDPERGRIDWILFQGPIAPVYQEIITDAFCGQYPSDHFPVIARFCWK